MYITFKGGTLVTESRIDLFKCNQRCTDCETVR